MGTYILGLTGQTGAGKSTVADMFKNNNIPVIDADEVARAVINDTKQCLADIVLEYGVEVLNVSGTLNRKRLSEIVFKDKAKLKRLNTITFPHIVREIVKILEVYKEKDTKLVVIDAPLLFESGLDKLCNKNIAVMAQVDTRMNRILIRDHLTDEQARDRINSQPPDEFYINRSDYVLKNDKGINALSRTLAEYMSTLEIR